MYKKANINTQALIMGALFITALVCTAAVSVRNASAASLGNSFVRFDRMKISTQTTGTVCAKPTTTATEAGLTVAFPTGYTLGAAGTFTVNTTNLAWPTGGTAWVGINTATNVTGQVVTFPSGELSVGTLYCFNWINPAAVTVKSSATANNVGTITTRTSVPATIDTSDFSSASIADDQIVVSATVPQAFSFALSGNTDSLGVLDIGTVNSSATPRTATVNTNAKNGWNVWAKGTNTGLTSALAAETIPAITPGTSSTLTPGTEGYITGVTSSQAGGGGTITVTAAFAGGAFTGSGLDTTLRTIATSTGTASNAVLTITNNASISADTPAASDYTDTITVVGAGLF